MPEFAPWGLDLHDTDTIEVKVVKTKSGTYRVWVNGPNGMLFRAYNVKKLQCDLDGDVLWEATLHNKKPEENH